ncbi:MAG: hydrogenase maturation nickel metallochaperone HypA [Oscillospiraceae bacterium]|nr:hydrogenase maturation nickel metallochaperone HypA [Oscillospiraceae bacterium]
MHELGIVFSIIDSVEKIGEENSLIKVSSVTLEVGEVSGIVPIYLTDCWSWAVEKSQLLKGSQLKIETLNAVTFCNNCEKTYPTIEHKKICPYCQSEDTFLLTGNEVNIKELEAM